MPITSIDPSAVISPTSASTLEVPMSRPTITSLSAFLTLCVRPFGPRAFRPVTAAALPAHGEAVAVAHVDIGDVRGALAHELGGHQHEALEARIDLLPPEPHLHTVVERDVQRPARIQREGHQPQAHLGQSALGREVARRHFRFGTGGTCALRQFGWYDICIPPAKTPP